MTTTSASPVTGRPAHVFNYTAVNLEAGYTPPAVLVGSDHGKLNSPYKVVVLPPGMSEDEFMDLIESADGWNNFVWIPWINDCHTDLGNAFDQAGIPYPEAPNGRIDIDDQLGAFMDRIKQWIKGVVIYGY